MTVAEMIEREAKGEEIDSVCFSVGDREGAFIFLPWETARSRLTYDYDLRCPPFIAWTSNFVLFVGCYEGVRWIEKVPRNPMLYEPIAVGGGC